MQTILLSCMAAVIVLLCIFVFTIKNQLNKLSKRCEQKFNIQNHFNRHFNKSLLREQTDEREKSKPRYFANGIMIFSLTAFLVSCSPKEDEVYAPKIPNYTVVNIEGCEYFLYPVTHGYSSLEHKGNCSNPIHTMSPVKNEKP